MPVTRGALVDALAQEDPAALRDILAAAGCDPGPQDAARAVAQRLADQLWWSYATPLGYAWGTGSLEEIVAFVAHRLRLYVPRDEDGWAAVRTLAVAAAVDLERRGIPVGALPPGTVDRLGRPWVAPTLLAAGAAATWGAGGVAGALAATLGAPAWRWVGWVPAVGPATRTLRLAAGAARLASGPAAVALAAVAVNQAFGANPRVLVPLLLGVGALGPQPVVDAVELARA